MSKLGYLPAPSELSNYVSDLIIYLTCLSYITIYLTHLRYLAIYLFISLSDLSELSSDL